jgi:hypothetical protein
MSVWSPEWNKLYIFWIRSLSTSQMIFNPSLVTFDGSGTKLADEVGSTSGRDFASPKSLEQNSIVRQKDGHKANLARAWVNLRDLELDEAWIPALSSNRLPDNFNITFRRYLLRRLSLLAHMVEIGLNSWVRSELINPLEAELDHLRARHEVLVTKTACGFTSWSCHSCHVHDDKQDNLSSVWTRTSSTSVIIPPFVTTTLWCDLTVWDVASEYDQ